MQIEESMVRDDYPTPEEIKRDGADVEEAEHAEEINDDDAEEMNDAVDEEHVLEYLGDDSGADVYVGMKALEDELDHLQTALDHLERKNDDIHAQLTELLQSNREARKQFRESLQIDRQQSK
ncbi:PREDICTED: UPF0184 protein C9orf16 homolog [Vollenhovia emeryi]|uniref:UPF0184 protein C9orf16 homolog n=1 Tax=Vollenhovia emeryi TaxID=411798 RepID=UPI0005F4CB4F|nr:PREDICTED: UPF0184 protein C9orf16 homolog [Vollenhovia emeryi]